MSVNALTGQMLKGVSCAHPEHKREVSLKMTIAAQVRRLVIHFDERTSIFDARELAQHAFDVIEDDHAPLAE